jgi:3-dehydroquinate synthase
MAASRAFEDLIVRSHAGPYRASFRVGALQRLAETDEVQTIVVVDDRVADLYAEDLRDILARPSTLRIEALEANKSLEMLPDYIDHLVEHRVRRGQTLIAVGGGIIQDIVCFLAATLLRGIEWRFIPTTLLAQADSCIGSKSSINVRSSKNIVGTFTPPAEIQIDVDLLQTLCPDDVRSGIGEMLKVHAIAGPERFDEIAAAYGTLLEDRGALAEYILRSLEYKRKLIELDEFDQGVRNVMNYGHSFGHAIESATQYAIPHGIAITIGMDMANHVASEMGRTTRAHVERMRPVLALNYRGYADTGVPFEAFMTAIGKDKKNTATTLKLVLPDDQGVVSLVEQTASAEFRAACESFLANGRSHPGDSQVSL